MEQQGGTHTHSRTTNRSDQRLCKNRNAPQKTKNRRVFTCCRLLKKVGNVVARAENSFMALNQQNLGLCIRFSRRQGLGQLCVHGRGQRIFFVNTVQGQRQNAAFEVL
jgi:hypothetical protein